MRGCRAGSRRARERWTRTLSALGTSTKAPTRGDHSGLQVQGAGWAAGWAVGVGERTKLPAWKAGCGPGPAKYCLTRTSQVRVGGPDGIWDPSGRCTRVLLPGRAEAERVALTMERGLC